MAAKILWVLFVIYIYYILLHLVLNGSLGETLLAIAGAIVITTYLPAGYKKMQTATAKK